MAANVSMCGEMLCLFNNTRVQPLKTVAANIWSCSRPLSVRYHQVANSPLPSIQAAMRVQREETIDEQQGNHPRKDTGNRDLNERAKGKRVRLLLLHCGCHEEAHEKNSGSSSLASIFSASTLLLSSLSLSHSLGCLLSHSDTRLLASPSAVANLTASVGESKPSNAWLHLTSSRSSRIMNHLFPLSLWSKCRASGDGGVDGGGDGSGGDTRDAIRRKVTGRTELGSPRYIENPLYVSLYLYLIHHLHLHLSILF